jgi:single-stranded DNA-binding protein
MDLYDLVKIYFRGVDVMNEFKCAGDLVVLFVNQTGSGKILRKFSVKTQKGTVPVTAWEEVGNPLENANKGDYVEVKGYVHTNLYEKDGKKIYSTEAVAEEIKVKSKEEAYDDNPF